MKFGEYKLAKRKVLLNMKDDSTRVEAKPWKLSRISSVTVSIDTA